MKRKINSNSKKASPSFTKIAISSIILLAIASLAMVRVSNCSWMSPNLASILGGVLSAVATTILGAIAIWQNIEYRKLNDILEKRTFKAQVLSSCPYFSVTKCIANKDETGKYIFEITLNNIGNSLATFVLPTEFEFSNLGYYYGKNSKGVVNTIYDIDYSNIEPNQSLTFISEPINYDFESTENNTFFAHMVISIVGHNQIQFDQQIQLEFRSVDNNLIYLSQHQSQFLNLYDN